MHEGMMYSGIFHGAYMMYDIVRQAVEEVGAENFDGQAFYDAAVKFNKSYEGLYEVGFTETEKHSDQVLCHIQVECRAERSGETY